MCTLIIGVVDTIFSHCEANAMNFHFSRVDCGNDLAVSNCVNTHITKTEYNSKEQRVSNTALFSLRDIS